MSSKQEKLAAARKKLKEFQGKNRDAEISKHKNVGDTTPQTFSKDVSLPSSESSPCCTPLLNDNKNIEYNQKNLQSYYVNHSSADQEKVLDESGIHRKFSDAFSNNSNSPVLWPEGSQQTYQNFNKKAVSESPEIMNIYEKSKRKEDNKNLFISNSFDNLSGLIKSNNLETLDFHSCHKNSYQDLNRSYSSHVSTEKIVKPQTMCEKKISKTDNLLPFKEDSKSHSNEVKEFFNDDSINTNSALNDIIKPLQAELQNHAQTINILVQQRNDAQNALAQMQNLLTEKSGEVNSLNQHKTLLTTSINNLNQRLLEAEETAKKLYAEKEDILKKNQEIMSSTDTLQAQFDSKEEECLELKRKYDEKDKESQELLFSLQKVQSQLSLCQIQIQQFSSGEHSALSVKVSQLQNENLTLKQKIEDLEKKLELENAEKEQSSQNFHVYAQQCNSQLSSLDSQLKSLTVENEKLKEENAVLTKNLSDIENTNKRNLSLQSFEKETADLCSKIGLLTKEKDHLQNDLKNKEEEFITLNKKLEERDSALKNMEVLLKEMETENRKLMTEVESPKPNEKLLATMESDKIAAAKAVSQNQKLKEQVVELEKAFMKMSQEKLELTDQLAHEKHISAELQKLLKNQNHDYNHYGHHEHHHDHDHDQDHDHGDDDGCHHKSENKVESLLNDSSEIEELRSIVRQLQDDKVELKARLNSFTAINTNSGESHLNKKCNHDTDENETDCENTKHLLQQMEEKVRRTMNEIAILDEEKEKLEHLVLQLQGETETIGEYITLYQKQRLLLRQRALEKDNQLLQLSKDKEELRSKLSSLDELVQHLIAERQNINIQPTSSEKFLTSTPEVSENTAGKIRALINEIGSTTLVSSNSVAFEHCSCCSGRLITI